LGDEVGLQQGAFVFKGDAAQTCPTVVWVLFHFIEEKIGLFRRLFSSL